MMKKTLAQRNHPSAERECVTLQEELDWLNSNPVLTEEEETDGGDQATANSPTPISKPIETPREEPTPRTAILPDRPRAAVEIEDAPVSASDVLLTIVAAGLKLSRATTNLSLSIKLLSKGRFFQGDKFRLPIFRLAPEFLRRSTPMRERKTAYKLRTS